MITPNLAKLAGELEAKAREYRAIAYETAIREAAEKPLNDGTASALEEIAARVRRIGREAGNVEQMQAALKEMVSQLESDVRRANSQLGSLPDITAFLFNPGRMFDMLGDTGRQDGLRQAAGIIRRYLDKSRDL